jgi:predicted anti-sigma-YlaC factor YlaD
VSHLTQKQFEDYASQRLQASELLAVSDHLDECEACRRRIEAALNADGAFLAIRSDVFDVEQSPAHLTGAQLADRVDNRLAGETLEVVTDHLSSCDQCALAVADLRAFRNEVSLDREYQPATGAASNWWRPLLESLPQLAWATSRPFLYAALGLLLVIFLGWLLPRKQSQQNPTQQIAVAPTPVLQTTPAPTPIQPAVLAQLKDGDRVFALDADGKLSGADDLPNEYQKLLQGALANQQVPRSSNLRGLTRAGSSLMSGNDAKDSFRLIEPVGKIVLRNAPAFRWSQMDGASYYVVEVYDEQFNVVATSPQLSTNSWTISQPLSRGKTYSWQVKANRDGEEVTSPRPPAPQAKFRVLDDATANNLARAEKTYASSHLTMALLYANAGLVAEAEQQLRLVLKDNPNSEIAQKLLRQVQAQRQGAFQRPSPTSTKPAQ